MSLILRNPKRLHLSFVRYPSLDSSWYEDVDEDVDDHVELRSPRTFHLQLIRIVYHHHRFRPEPQSVATNVEFIKVIARLQRQVEE